jgi:hypothetical protein
MENNITYVAMDTHKKQHKIALHYPCQEEVVEFTINNTHKKNGEQDYQARTRKSRILL